MAGKGKCERSCDLRKWTTLRLRKPPAGVGIEALP
jgi:hypothetical protein